ncbi:CPCC family cysteine-rich protein [Domibacillus sp. A3M-37]|uniref:CPCC family cysteine-rich protein n=1 Tax=Domibacillus TaxID=1433999 RepID=UPI0006183319|nr:MULTISPECIES: CPCC family cysteine-rich protein [Domibacillus]MCP3762790.1 CPCC family cysteine-rich protein [Domibacillus sp. A3M-37]
MKYTCPCCGYKTLDEEPPGTFDICEICYWEDDNVQFDDPDFEGGANVVSLRQAQRNFAKLGACEKDFIKYVRKPNKSDLKGFNVFNTNEDTDY